MIVEKLGFARGQVLEEPVGRDTLNAVGLTAAVLASRDPDAVFAVLTADHLIEPLETLTGAFRLGFEIVEAEPDTLVTFSIRPSYPATAFGYIEQGDPLGRAGAFVVRRYVEKPDLGTAQAYLRAGNFGWSSGMFVFQARRILDLIGRYQPMARAGLDRVSQAWFTPQRGDVLRDVYPTLPKISIDYAVMEPAARERAAGSGQVVTIPLDLTWLDVGSWNNLAETIRPDGAGCRSIGLSQHESSTNVLTVSDDPTHLIATVGCEGLMIIHTRDATLVCAADRSQDLKKLVDRLPPERK